MFLFVFCFGYAKCFRTIISHQFFFFNKIILPYDWWISLVVHWFINWTNWIVYLCQNKTQIYSACDNAMVTKIYTVNEMISRTLTAFRPGTERLLIKFPIILRYFHLFWGKRISHFVAFPCHCASWWIALKSYAIL